MLFKIQKNGRSILLILYSIPSSIGINSKKCRLKWSKQFESACQNICQTLYKISYFRIFLARLKVKTFIHGNSALNFLPKTYLNINVKYH